MHTTTANIAQTDFEVAAPTDRTPAAQKEKISIVGNLKYTATGMGFGILLVKSQVISWYRIQEMFHLQSFHMYGVIGSAVITGIISVFLIKKFNIKTIKGEPIILQPKKFNWGIVWGGLLFGFGWAMTGACPGPLFAQIGSGITVTIVTLLSAVAGTWVFGYVREKLPR